MAAQRGPKTIAFQFGDFNFMTNNHVTAIADKDGVDEEFHPITDFLTAGPLNYALTTSPQMKMEVIS